MRAYAYVGPGRFELLDKPRPELRDSRDAIVRVTLGSICTSDLHIKHGSVPRAVPGVTVGHEMVGVVERVGDRVASVRPGDRVAVNVETFCGECFFCRHGYVNNCTDPDGGWALGCRIDGGQAEYVRVPHADQGLTPIPDTVSDEQALFVGDILATGFWAARISEIGPEDTVLVIGAGPTGVCTLLCAMLKRPRRIIVCEKSPERMRFVREHVLVTGPETCRDFVLRHSDHGGADVVLEVAGTSDTFRLAWECARPNAVVTVVALYDEPQVLPLPDMYGKNLTFKTGGVDGCDGGKDRHDAAHHAPLSAEPDRRGVPPVRDPVGRCGESGGRVREIAGSAGADRKTEKHTGIMMTLDDFLKLARAGRPLASAETLEFMDRMSDEARRITCRLNASYHTPAEVRELLEQLFGKPVDASFYTDFGKNISVGRNVFINACCHFQDHGGVTLGDGCMIGHNVVFATLNHELDPARRAEMTPAPIVLGRNVWVGSNATILQGVTIGDGAVVAAGAVVTRDVPAATVVGGVPARPIRRIG